MRTTESYDIGRLWWGVVRDCLKLAKFKGHEVEWIESRGWFNREFTIRADPTVHQALKVTLKKAAAEFGKG